jgi:hypothetical protein
MVMHTQASYGLAHRLTGELWTICTRVKFIGTFPIWGKAAWSSFFGPGIWVLVSLRWMLAKFDLQWRWDTRPVPHQYLVRTPTARG